MSPAAVEPVNQSPVQAPSGGANSHMSAPEAPMPSSSSVSSRSSSISRMQHRPHRQNRLGQFILGQTLGEGEFGKVKLAWAETNGVKKQYAIKLIRQDKSRGVDEAQKNKVTHEINSSKSCSHPHIIRSRHLMRTESYIGIVLDYASGGDMFNYIYKNGRPDERTAKKSFAQLVSGVSYLHQKGIVHRDSKLENSSLDSNNNILISDFGFANSFRTSSGIRLMKTSCGSPCYAAPEVVNSEYHYDGKKADVWSVGVISFTFLAGYSPFDDDPNNHDSENIFKSYQYIATTPSKFPDWIGVEARDSSRRILVVDPENRAKMSEIASHSWSSEHKGFSSITAAEHEGAAAWQRGSIASSIASSASSSSTSASSALANSALAANTSHIPRASSELAAAAAKARPMSAMPAPATTMTVSASGAPIHHHRHNASSQQQQRQLQQQQLQQLQQQQQQQHAQQVSQQRQNQANLARSASSAAAAAAAMPRSSSTAAPSTLGGHNTARPPVRSSSVTPGAKIMDANAKYMAANYARDKGDEVPDLAIAPSPQRLTQPSKPRPISFQPPPTKYFEPAAGSPSFMPRTSQPRVESSRESSKNGEISKPSSMVETEQLDAASARSEQVQAEFARQQHDKPQFAPAPGARHPSMLSASQSQAAQSASRIPRSSSINAQGAQSGHRHTDSTIKPVASSAEPPHTAEPATPELATTASPPDFNVATPKRSDIAPPSRRTSSRKSAAANQGTAPTHNRRMSAYYQPTHTSEQQQHHRASSDSSSISSESSASNATLTASASASQPKASVGAAQPRSRFRWSTAFWSRKPDATNISSDISTPRDARRASWAVPSAHTADHEARQRASSIAGAAAAATSSSAYQKQQQQQQQLHSQQLQQQQQQQIQQQQIHSQQLHGQQPRPRVYSGIPTKIVSPNEPQQQKDTNNFKRKTINFLKRKSMVG